MAFVPNTRTVRLYQNTGFDLINSPAVPSLLDSFTYVDIPAINALQITRLNSVCIKATEDQVTNADYCSISDGTHVAYYVVTDYHMEKPDTCTLSIDMDYILTAGGVSSNDWDVIDGITERHHVTTAQDTLFSYVEDDPYLVPSKPLGIHYESTFLGKASDANNSIVVAEATVPLDEIGDTTVTPQATAYTVSSSGSECVVPKLPKLASNSSADMYNYPGGIPQLVINPSTKYYDISNSVIQEGLSRVRELGIENGSIIAQYIIPKEYASAPSYDPSSPGNITVLHGKDGTYSSLSSDFNFEYGTAQNKRVYAGICNKYGLLAIGSGNSVEFNPEDIKDGTKPSISVISDPRPNGKPYFRYKKYKGDTTNFFMNCIAGLNWQNVPLLYTDKSGSEIDTIRFNTEQSIKNQNMETEIQRETWDTLNPLSFRNKKGGILSGKVTDMVGFGMATVGGLTGLADESTMGAMSDVYDIGRKRQNAAAQELQEFRINQNIVAPQLMFPRSEGLRDFLGNGCYAYRYYLEASDITKFDKILNMYGYRITEPLDKTMFNVRSKFSYVKAQGVSIGGSLPAWLRKGMEAELTVGKRFWQVAPNKSYYATNGGNT